MERVIEAHKKIEELQKKENLEAQNLQVRNNEEHLQVKDFKEEQKKIPTVK